MKTKRPDGMLWPSEEDVHESFTQGDGQGVKVAVIDSGIDFNHPLLESLELTDNYVGRVEENAVLLEQTDSPSDLHGHGTAVAYLVRQMAPQVQIGSFRIFTGKTLSGPGKLIRHAVKKAIDLDYQIINLSLGVEDQVIPGRLPRFLHHYKEITDFAYCSGVHLVTACNNRDSRRREWPAHFATCISVEKVCCGENELFWRPGHLIEFGAKGIEVSVPGPDGGTRFVSGSSYAAPRVTGWVARLLSMHPHINPPQMQALLRQVALERPHFGLHSSYQGSRSK